MRIYDLFSKETRILGDKTKLLRITRFITRLYRTQSDKNDMFPILKRQTPKNFDNTTIVDRLRTFSWSNNSYPTGVVKPVYGYPTFPLTAKAVKSKGLTYNNFVNNPPL